MRKTLAGVAAGAAVVAASAMLATAPAQAATCPAGAVDEPTAGDDIICLSPGEKVLGSQGDDTYHLMGADAKNKIWIGNRDVPGDPGTDTVSLERWDHGYTESTSGMFGVWLMAWTDPEKVRYTPYADTVGQPGAAPTQSNDMLFYTLGGGDTLYNMTGTFYTGTGGDTIYGVTLDTVAYTQGGSDVVYGDAGADQIKLGSGNDFANVSGGGADTVWGGLGSDTVNVSGADVTYSAKRI